MLGVVVVALLFTPLFRHFILPTYSGTSEIAYIGIGTEAPLLPADLPNLAMSSNVVNRAIADGHLHIDSDTLLKRLSVRESPHSDVIPVSFSSKDAALATSVPNAIANATVAEFKNLATSQYNDLIDKLNVQVADLQKQISTNNARYQASVRNDSMAGVTTGLDSLAARVDSVDQLRAAAQSKLAQDTAAAKTAESMSGSSNLGSVIREETLTHDPAFTAMQLAQAKDRANYETVKAGYTEAYPGFAGLKEQVTLEKQASDREALAAERDHRGASPTYAAQLVAQQTARSLVAGDRAQLAALDRQYAQTKSRLMDLPRYTVPADEFRVKRDGAIAAYTQVEARLRTALADKAAAASLNSVVVLDRATEAVPNMSSIVASALVVLLIFGLALGAAYLAELLDPRIRNQADVEGLYGSPLIGSV
ncbi:MAG: hypothetical protein IAI50_08105 [Candidatus Eremiobacteraeota bacterium]|nr:hypothetical protein [Candidatus Eremiobacteraeota bacterium]